MGPYNITVTTTEAVNVTPVTLSPFNVGEPFNQTLTSTGGTAPYTYTVPGGGLPDGITLTSGGVMAGTPTASGPYSFTVRSTATGGALGNRTYSGTAVAPAPIPTLSEWAMILFGMILAGGAALFVQRRQTAA